MGKNILIIGGGLGGLTTGALLAKEGYKVTVLEKNRTIGGGLQCFGRKGVSFETGMHVLGGFLRGRVYIRYAGIWVFGISCAFVIPTLIVSMP